ncbi:hypothetical protein [Neorhizobium galegae]|uniref:hypothetical protein n=1 Tax=Neorhizobium galegae TaxID=399 RepID=UPI000622296E|nr:hypothetical protein [Neorhizobium galegae]CDZ54026.1 Hypothetical protein NGAL_HAMBI2427_54460 [Neorhizobium galegae bv. orientalis]
MKTPIHSAGEAMSKIKTSTLGNVELLKPAGFGAFNLTDYRNVYHAIMTIEEAVCQAGNHALAGRHRIDDTASSDYLYSIQEFLSAERADLIEKLRAVKFPKQNDEEQRICLILEYEAWCGEFRAETLALLAASSLPTKAI